MLFSGDIWRVSGCAVNCERLLWIFYLFFWKQKLWSYEYCVHFYYFTCGIIQVELELDQKTEFSSHFSFTSSRSKYLNLASILRRSSQQLSVLPGSSLLLLFLFRFLLLLLRPLNQPLHASRPPCCPGGGGQPLNTVYSGVCWSSKLPCVKSTPAAPGGVVISVKMKVASLVSAPLILPRRRSPAAARRIGAHNRRFPLVVEAY